MEGEVVGGGGRWEVGGGGIRERAVRYDTR